MCELFGYSGDREQSLATWLMPFRTRGGSDNPDGWGVASWHGLDADVVKSPKPGASSERFAQLATELRTALAIAHVRHARHPPVPGMLNTHPFVHECCGRQWVFAHNGLVPEVIAWGDAGRLCHPDGETDSEHAFCHLLTEIAASYGGAKSSAWIAHLAKLAERIATLGKFNFLLSDGQVLIAYGHDRLHHLELDDAQDRRSIVATEALTDDGWQLFSPGELRVYRNGALLAQRLADQRHR
ncbi:class II glutamine amidotransferase [Sulfurisoma sediminicola]|uniref:Glutamine amidotransferase n=1 Tax=Sulfurisoma sediminicola TaxID=1381557 RepID=A0A497XE99_9PROT|nr:class II glutamine amidotransferase [Sulfurisoma sediminicola]RLJ65044.1 glutamine amidotransferase [Sulfurisoma sediminicola]